MCNYYLGSLKVLLVNGKMTAKSFSKKLRQERTFKHFKRFIKVLKNCLSSFR